MMEQNTFILTATVGIVVAIIAYKVLSKKPTAEKPAHNNSNNNNSNNNSNNNQNKDRLPYGNNVVEPKDKNIQHVERDNNNNIKNEEKKEDNKQPDVVVDDHNDNKHEEQNNNVEIKKEDENNKKGGLRVISGVYETRGRRPTMEDKHFSADKLDGFELQGKVVSMFAIYDGHRGTKASEFLEEHLHDNILSSEAFKNGDVEVAIKEGFAKTDAELLNVARSSEPKVMDGSTAAVALLIGNTLYAANCGDAEVILARKVENGDINEIALSKLHKPTDPEEKKRITSEGGMVLQGRVGGTLAVSRAFGDLDFKTPYEDDDIKLGVLLTADPYITVTELIPSEDLFIVIGCDGVWERLSRADSINFVASKINDEANLDVVAEELVNYALNSGSQDNISAIVVKLNWE